MIEKEKLKNLIGDKFPGIYNSVSMDKITNSIENADEIVRIAVEKYLSEGVEPDIEIEGFTYESLKKDHSMNPIAAMLTLDYLIKQPEKAKESLKKGHDFIHLN